MESLETDVLIVGAGVIGLACAMRLPQGTNALVIEKNEKPGQETSSRNSEVIHSGIHYPAGSLKTRWCIDGRDQIYSLAVQYDLPYQQTGKYVVAASENEEAYLATLAKHCDQERVPYQKVPGGFLERKEPLLKVRAGLFFPLSGILDSHSFVKFLEQKVLERGIPVAYRHRVSQLSPNSALVAAPQGEVAISAKVVINAAGLGAAALSNRALSTDRYEHRFCQGRYFLLPPSWQGKLKALVYPVPEKDGLGVHVTLDLTGQARLGPDVAWLSKTIQSDDANALYGCDWESLREPFARAASRYLVGVEAATLSPGLVGVRPKLFVSGDAHRDFLVERQGSFIHCLGIESPGLTASLAIADQVSKLVGEAL